MPSSSQKFSKYAPSLIADPRSHMNKFISGVFDLVKMECIMTLLIKEMDISRLMTHA